MKNLKIYYDAVQLLLKDNCEPWQSVWNWWRVAT